MNTQRELQAGFFDFMKKQAPPSRGNPLTRALNPKMVQDVLERSAHLNILKVKVSPKGDAGVLVTFGVQEEPGIQPVNRSRSIQQDLRPLQGALEGYMGVPVDLKVSVDLGDDSYDMDMGEIPYVLQVTPKGWQMQDRMASAARVALRAMRLASRR